MTDDPNGTEHPLDAAIHYNGHRTRVTIWLATLLILLTLGTYSCGPEALCYLDDGTPASNAFGATWCERDGINGPTVGDTSLEW